MTVDQGSLYYVADPATPEPPHASIVLSDGPTGTAYQRHFNDGLWHSSAGAVVTWAHLVKMNVARGGVIVTYIAPVEED